MSPKRQAGCATGAPRTSKGPFADVRSIGIRVGHQPVEGERVERPLLSGTVRQPPNAAATTQLVIAARVGETCEPELPSRVAGVTVVVTR